MSATLSDEQKAAQRDEIVKRCTWRFQYHCDQSLKYRQRGRDVFSLNLENALANASQAHDYLDLLTAAGEADGLTCPCVTCSPGRWSDAPTSEAESCESVGAQ